MENTFLSGLGLGVTSNDPNDPNYGWGTTTGGGTTTSPGGGGGAVSWIDKILNWGGQAADIYQSTQNQPGGSGNYPTQPPVILQQQAMSNTTKIALGVGAIALIGGIAYVVSRKKK